jgi:hypothetical protein
LEQGKFDVLFFVIGAVFKSVFGNLNLLAFASDQIHEHALKVMIVVREVYDGQVEMKRPACPDR